MGAGDYGDLLWAFVYASDDGWGFDAAAIGAAAPKYYLGYMVDGGIEELPCPAVSTIPKIYANSARPQGYKAQKTEIWNAPLVTKCHAFDLVPFYVGMGKMAAGAGHPSGNFVTSLIDTGETPTLVWHGENNKLGAADQAREYYKAKCKKLEVTFEDGFLSARNTFALQRMYDMSTDNVVRTTVAPINRGSANGQSYFRYPSRHPSLNVTWHTGTFDKELSDDNTGATKLALFQNFAFSVETDLALDPIEDGNDYLPNIQARGEWTCSDLVIELLMDPTSTILDDLRLLRDGTTGSVSGDYVLLTFPRLHANDFISFKFKQAILRQVITPQTESQAKDGREVVKLVFCNYTDIEVTENQATTAGATNPNVIADYEAVT